MLFRGVAGRNLPPSPLRLGGGQEDPGFTMDLLTRSAGEVGHYVVLEKKEEYAKSTLIDSQSKWTLFSKDILNIAKELL